MIEIAGLPSAGKTTTATMLARELVSASEHPIVIPEAAQANPLGYKKSDFRFNVWSVCETLQSFLHYEDSGLLIFDRGFVDALAWLRWFRNTRSIDERTASALESLIMVPHWFARIDVVLVLFASFPTALRRRGSPGTIVNADVFSALKSAYDSVLADLARSARPKVYVIDTDAAAPNDVTDWARSRIFAAIDDE